MLSLSDYIRGSDASGWKLSITQPACALRQQKLRVRACQTRIFLRFSTWEKGIRYHHFSSFPNTHWGNFMHRAADAKRTYENLQLCWRCAWKEFNA